ncbi:MAG: Fic family protein [candidate division NC10 bacterium]
MKTLRRFSEGLDSVPTATAWYLADLGRAVGKQELFTRQAPQRLKALREHAMIESAVSSNRIEGVEVDPGRVRTIVFGKPSLRDRNEEEVRGYRDALKLIHEGASGLQVTEETILRLHRLSRGEIWDAGRYKEQDGAIIEKSPDGRERVRFRPVSAAETPAAMRELVALWGDVVRERHIHPLIAMAAFNLDLLCIHPFRDGNGRVSRLLLLLQCYHFEYEVGRYISMERLIEQSKERYYETLEQSSTAWHAGKHDPWPFVNYLLFTLKTAYREFEERVGQTAEPRGAKTELVLAAIQRTLGPFAVADLQRESPGVGLDLIRATLKKLRAVGRVECLGRGQHARWQKTAQWELGNTQSIG